jgi:predicted RNA-binding Zn-ribbon protein involved in translation (DUF1610 family)
VRIRLGCPRCGDVELGVHDVHLEIALAAPGASRYRFGCPGCGAQVARPATPRILLILKAHGVAAQTPDAPPDPLAPAFTPDDLLDFHLRLATSEPSEALFDTPHEG